LKDLYPFKIETPSPNFLSIQNRFIDEKFYFDAYGSLLKFYKEFNISPFSKNDSHLNFIGSQFLIKEFLSFMGRKIEIASPILEDVFVSGDLGRKYGHGGIGGYEFMPVAESWDFSKITPKLLDKFDPVGHGGIYRKWRNDDFFLDKKVIVFGNSFFERGINYNDLSYWFSRVFRETIFVWTNKFDKELIALENPDVVVCQSIERFIGTTPAS
jgi:hypothetical protein